MRRFFDLLFSTLAILVLSPLLLPIMIGLKLTGEHYIFYFQERMGKNEKTFKVLKFATMLKDSPNMAGGAVTRKNDPRILPMGHFLRKTKINELPQLFNIWIGQMSIVGPRPLTVQQFYNYSETQRQKISLMTPGLSGIGSLVFRDEEEVMAKSGMDYNEIHDTIIAEYKGNLECWYAEHASIANYFKIIWFTFLSVFKYNIDFKNKFTNLPQPEGILKDLL